MASQILTISKTATTTASGLVDRQFKSQDKLWQLDVPDQDAFTMRNTSTRATTQRQLDDLGIGTNIKKRNTKKRLKEQKSAPSLGTNSLSVSSQQLSSSSIKPTTCKESLYSIYTISKATLKMLIIDCWKRNTMSSNDPYCKVTLKPIPDTKLPQFFNTLPILGGGASVDFHSIYDEGEYIFLLKEDTAKEKKKYLSGKYLKVEVLDYETGTTDRNVGVARILLEGIDSMNDINKEKFCKVSLYDQESGAWAGKIEIAATFLEFDDKEDLYEILEDQNERIAKHNPKPDITRMLQSQSQLNRTDMINVNNNNKKSRVRSDSELKVFGKDNTKQDDGPPGLNRMATLNEDVQEEQDKKVKGQKKKAEKSKYENLQSFVTDVVLFLSLLLSGALFYGLMNVYEVDQQREHLESYSIIDAIRWSVVTTSTVGYGDIYPRTSGGKLFGSFFIIFGVSLLARLLNVVLNAVSVNYEEARQRRKMGRKKMTLSNLEEFDEDGDGIITKYEYLKTMLIRRGNTTKDVIEEIMEIFAEYDQDGDGTIDKEEIRMKMKQNTDKRYNSKKLINIDDDELNDNANNNNDKKEKNEDNNDNGQNDEEDGELLNGNDKQKEYDTNDPKQSDNDDNDKEDNEDNDDSDVDDLKQTDNDNKNKLSDQESNKIDKITEEEELENIEAKHNKIGLLQDAWDEIEKEEEEKDDFLGLNQVSAEIVAEEAEEKMYYALKIAVRGADDLQEQKEFVEVEDSFWSFFMGWLVFVLYLSFGAMIFAFIEDKPYEDMLWFFVVTTCTVGYGDVYPETSIGKIVNAFFITISVGLFVSTFSSTFDYIYARQESLIEQKQTKKKDIKNMARKYTKTLWAVLPKHDDIKQENKNDEERKKNLIEEQEQHKVTQTSIALTDIAE